MTSPNLHVPSELFERITACSNLWQLRAAALACRLTALGVDSDDIATADKEYCLADILKSDAALVKRLERESLVADLLPILHSGVPLAGDVAEIEEGAS